jgi:FKBP-type peptidyl-prolyl cis-trans isomerase
VTKPGQTQPGGAAPARNPKREAKRALAREAAARRAAAKRRRQARMGAVIGLVVVALVVGVVLLLNRSHTTNPNADASSTPSAASAAPSANVSTPPALAQKPTVADPKGTPAPTSLKVTTLVQGDGPAVQSGQHLYVNYTGVSFKDGTEFDSSWKAGRTPFDFTIGQGNVIPGWDQGLVGVKVGSRVQLDIPANLAYGDNPSGGQPAGALRFVVDVLSAQ